MGNKKIYNRIIIQLKNDIKLKKNIINLNFFEKIIVMIYFIFFYINFNFNNKNLIIYYIKIFYIKIINFIYLINL